MSGCGGERDLATQKKRDRVKQVSHKCFLVEDNMEGSRAFVAVMIQWV